MIWDKFWYMFWEKLRMLLNTEVKLSKISIFKDDLEESSSGFSVELVYWKLEIVNHFKISLIWKFQAKFQ